MKYTTILTLVVTATANPVRRMHYGIMVNGIVYPYGYSGTLANTNEQLVPAKHEQIVHDIPTPTHENQQVCKTMSIHSTYSNIYMKSSVKSQHTFETDLHYQVSDVFSNYSTNPTITIHQGDTVLDTYTLDEILIMMNNNAWNNFDNFVYFTFDDCMTYTKLINSFGKSTEQYPPPPHSGFYPEQNNAFQQVEFVHVTDIDKTRSVAGCVGNVECIINWCNVGHDSSSETYIYYSNTQTCVYPKDTITRPSKNNNLVFNIE